MQIFLLVLSIFWLVTVTLSLIKDDYWIFKLLEYPRFQKLVFILMTLLGWTAVLPFEKQWYKIVTALLLISAFYLLYKIWPYTIFYKKEMHHVNNTEGKPELKIYSANVLQTNTHYQKILGQIKVEDPDIIFLLETNKAWADALSSLDSQYQYSLKLPLENTYGLLFFSRLEFEKAEIKYLVKNDLPSIDVILKLNTGDKIQLWGIHPEPPVPGESLTATAKDKELMKIAFKARACKIPCIVFGDLNDVAWSHTTELFRKTSGLLDPRRGRGFYSTFSAHHLLIRYPLDYIFCSSHFGLISMRRMPKNGSDHFATSSHLVLNKNLAMIQDAPEADTEELKEAQEIKEKPTGIS